METRNRKLFTKRRGVLFLAAIAVLVVSTAVAVVLITQQFSPVSVQPRPSAQITSNCGTLRSFGAAPVEGSSGVRVFNCFGPISLLPIAAFRVDSSGPAVPEFDLSSTGYTSLKVIAFGGDCTSTDALTITNGEQVSLDTTGGYSYCAFFENAPAGQLGGFQITWNTP